MPNYDYLRDQSSSQPKGIYQDVINGVVDYARWNNSKRVRRVTRRYAPKLHRKYQRRRKRKS